MEQYEDESETIVNYCLITEGILPNCKVFMLKYNTFKGNS